MRGLVSVPLLAVIAYFRKSLFIRIDWRNWRVILVRAFAELASTMLFLTALAHMPLANITAILQSLPLTVTMFAAVFFGEAVGWRRWSAILVGFIGVLIIIRPGSDGFNEYAVLALVAVGFITLRDAITRRLDRSVPSLFVAFVSAIPIFLFGGAMTVTTGWTPISWSMGMIVIVAAIAITCGYSFAVMAMRNGDISFVAPFRYTGMIWAILFGFLLFGNLPDQMTILGSCIVIGMGGYAFHRERVRQKASAT
jgi:S-adenosylmethionine uptake transporter